MISSRGVHEMSRIGFKLIPMLDPTTSGGGGQNPLSTEQKQRLDRVVVHGWWSDLVESY